MTETRHGILIVDDHPMMRRGLRDVLADEATFEVVGEAVSLREALAYLARQPVDLVLVDISLGQGSGLDLIKRLRAEHPEVKTLVVSMHDESVYAVRALRAGAMGYVNKAEPEERLIEAIKRVLGGQIALSPAMTDRLLLHVVRSEPGTVSGVESLSNRELEVFQLIGEGMSTRQIAEKLCLSVKTIETHREHIKVKLNLESGDELRRFAVSWGVQST